MTIHERIVLIIGVLLWSGWWMGWIVRMSGRDA